MKLSGIYLRNDSKGLYVSYVGRRKVMSFLDPSHVQLNFRQNSVELLGAFRFYYYERGYKEWVCVPRGFKTNLANLPFRRSFLKPIDKAAILHDYLYSDDYTGKVDRYKADVIFLKAMAVAKVNIVYRWGAYVAVRLFGSFFYKKSKK